MKLNKTQIVFLIAITVIHPICSIIEYYWLNKRQPYNITVNVKLETKKELSKTAQEIWKETDKVIKIMRDARRLPGFQP